MKLQFRGADINDIEIIEDDRMLNRFAIYMGFGKPANIA